MEVHRVGHVRIDRLLGEGGMGAVYLGFDEKLERAVAVKVLSRKRRLKPDAKARFLREARLLSRLDDPGICRIYDLIEDDDTDYLVLEYIDGANLAESAAGAITRAELLPRFLGIARALAAAHREGIVHRDLKPDNVMVTTGGQIKVLDFGIARSLGARVVAEPATGSRPDPNLDVFVGDGAIHEPGCGPTVSMADEMGGATAAMVEDAPAATLRTRVGSLVGTIRYMSPEQASGAEVTEASDLYSLGVMMQELMTGTAVYGESTGMDLLLRVYRADTVPVTDLDPEIARLIEELTRIDPAARPDAELVVDRLKRILDRPRRRRRHRLRLAAIAAVVGAAVVAAAMIVQARFQVRRQAELAQTFARQGEEIAWRIRAEHLSPAHDLRPAIAEMRARMERLEDRMREAGDPALGPGHAALGRGHMALGDFDEARRHLEAAADAGFSSPETDFALGITIGSQYGEGLELARRIDDPDRRAAEIDRLNRELRDPALVHLEASLEDPATYPGYVRGLIALYSEKYEEALREADEVATAAPWFYEAAMLKGEINLRWATAKGIDNRDLESERRLWFDAADSFSEAVFKARSFPRARTRLCAVHARLIENSLIARDGTMGATDIDAAFDICQEALDLDPEEAQALVFQSGLSSLRARLEAMAGRDPGPSFAAARDFADRAIEIDPDLVVAHNMAGWVRFWSAMTGFFAEGKDPIPELRRAIEDFEAVKRLTPNDPNVDGYLGDSYWLLAGFAHATGGDPDPWIRGGFEIIEGAWEDHSGKTPLAVTLANLLVLEAKCMAAHGEDATDPLTRAVSVCERLVEDSNQPGDYAQLAEAEIAFADLLLKGGKRPDAALDAAFAAANRAVELSPEYFLPFMWRGWVGRMKAIDDEMRLGQSDAAARRAIVDFEKGLTLAPDDYTCLMGIGSTHLLSARDLLDDGRDAASRLNEARLAIERAVGLRPNFGELRRILGELELLEGRQRILEGSSPVPAFDAADRALETALETGYDDAATLHLKAEVELWRARWRRSREEPVAEDLNRGLATIGEALAINPRMAAAEMLRGELELELAGVLGHTSEADAARHRARDAFERAVAMNPLLERRVFSKGI